MPELELNSKEDLLEILNGIISDVEAVKASVAVPEETQQDDPEDDDNVSDEPDETSEELSGDEISDLLGL